MTTQSAPRDNPSLLTLCASEGVPKTACIAALLVGTVLNLINQGDVLWGDAELNLGKMGLTFIVPYCVATYGAVAARQRAIKMEGARETGSNPRGEDGGA